MRQALCISLPAAEAKQIKLLTKRRGYENVSEYVKYLFKADAELISETELLQDARIARREYKSGKVKQANSLADLL